MTGAESVSVALSAKRENASQYFQVGHLRTQFSRQKTTLFASGDACAPVLNSFYSFFKIASAIFWADGLYCPF
jgi:hypothetical protein